MANLTDVQAWAHEMMTHHITESGWSFGFDHAKMRAGLCDFKKKRISVSRYLAARYDDDEVRQILLHEIAHALAGSKAGHGPKWRTIAKQIGYDGKRTHDGTPPTISHPSSAIARRATSFFDSSEQLARSRAVAAAEVSTAIASSHGTGVTHSKGA
jgi:hypothetical protein